MCGNCADASKPYASGPKPAGTDVLPILVDWATSTPDRDDWPLIEFEDDGTVRWAGP